MDYEIKPELDVVLEKLKKRDKVAYLQIVKKIEEIVDTNPNHYKNLRYDLKEFKRVHIKNSFVLVFKYSKEKQLISFIDYDHHDIIYQKRYVN